MRGTQNIEDLGKAFLPDNLADAYHVQAVSGHPNGQVTLRDPEHEVLLRFALDDPSLDCLDECGPVVGVYNGFADTENHRFETPFRVASLTRSDRLVAPGLRTYTQVRWGVGG